MKTSKWRNWTGSAWTREFNHSVTEHGTVIKKENTHRRWVAVAALFWLAAVPLAQAFYNPSAGRWLNRDPLLAQAFYRDYARHLDQIEANRIQESRGHFECAPYLIVRNATVIDVDMDGARYTPNGEDIAITDKNRRNSPQGMTLVAVSKCEIRILYGHNFTRDFSRSCLQWIWNIVPEKDNQPKGSAYAAVIGCGASIIPNEIPLPGYTPVDKVIPVDDASEETDLARETYKAKRAAVAQAKIMCKDTHCDCRKIHITVDSYGLSLGELLTYPRPTSETIDCKNLKD